MKYFRIILTISLILSVYCGYSQTMIGAFGGLSNSKLLGEIPDKASYKSLPGLTAGLQVDFKINNTIRLSLQPGINQEGTKVFYRVAGIPDPVDSVKFRLNYFSLPILFKVLSSNQKLYAIGGVESAWLTSNDLFLKDEKSEQEFEVASYNFVMHFGAGYRIPLGFPTIYIELRYAQGLVNLVDDKIDNTYLRRVKTNSLKVLAGIEIPLSKSKN